jgi:hypothetical protein
MPFGTGKKPIHRNSTTWREIPTFHTVYSEKSEFRLASPLPMPFEIQELEATDRCPVPRYAAESLRELIVLLH